MSAAAANSAASAQCATRAFSMHARRACTVSPSEFEIRRQPVEEVLDLLRRVEPREQAALGRRQQRRAARRGAGGGHRRGISRRKASGARAPLRNANSTGLGVLPPPRKEEIVARNRRQNGKLSSYFPGVIAFCRISFYLQGSCRHRSPNVFALRRHPQDRAVLGRGRRRCSIASSVRRAAPARLARRLPRRAGAASGAAPQPAAPARPAEPLTIVLRERIRQFAKSSPAIVAKPARKIGLKPTLVDMADLDVATLAKAQAAGRDRRHLGRGRAAGARRARLRRADGRGRAAPRRRRVRRAGARRHRLCGILRHRQGDRRAARGARRQARGRPRRLRSRLRRAGGASGSATRSRRWRRRKPRRGTRDRSRFRRQAAASADPGIGRGRDHRARQSQLLALRQGDRSISSWPSTARRRPTSRATRSTSMPRTIRPMSTTLLKLAGLRGRRQRCAPTSSRRATSPRSRSRRWRPTPRSTGHQYVKALIADGEAKSWIAGRQLIDLIEHFPIALDGRAVARADAAAGAARLFDRLVAPRGRRGSASADLRGALRDASAAPARASPRTSSPSG